MMMFRTIALFGALLMLAHVADANLGGAAIVRGQFGQFGASSAHLDKHVNDKFRRGFVNRDSDEVEKVDASSLHKSFDRSSIAQEAAKTANLAHGYPHVGLGHAGSSGAEKKVLAKKWDRGSSTAQSLAKLRERNNQFDAKTDSGVTRANQRAATSIGRGRRYGIGAAAAGHEVKDLFQTRRKEAESRTNLQQTLLKADHAVDRFDRGAVNK